MLLSPEAVPDEHLVNRAVRDYLSAHGMVRHQLESYNHFIEHMLEHIIQENSDITNVSSDGKTSYTLQFCNVVAMPPAVKESDGFERPIQPHVARLRGLTYASSIAVDVVHDKIDQTTTPPKLVSRKIFREVVICRLPVMLQSNLCYLRNPDERKSECEFDQGGYFIINGNEKALLAQEKLRTNYPYVFPCKLARFMHVCEVRSCHELKMRSTSTLYVYINSLVGGNVPEIAVVPPFIEMQIPLPSFFRILGVSTREEALSYIPTSDERILRVVHACFESDIHAASTVEDIMDWIGREGTKELTKERRSKYLEHIFSNEVLPHMGLKRNEHTDKRKLIFLGHMICKLVSVQLGLTRCDDRDNYANKRIDTSGTLMSLLFRQLYRNFLKTVSAQLFRLLENGKIDNVNIGDVINHKKITGGFKYAFATGNWGIQKGGNGQNGVAQVLSRMTTISALANLRRINTPISREGKAPKPRQLHYTSWGIVCPVETPEGGSCGLVKNLALLAHVRLPTFSTPLAEFIVELAVMRPLLRCTPGERRDGTSVIVNGVIIGIVEKTRAPELTEKLRMARRSHCVAFDTSISHKEDGIYLNSDAGGLCRPVIIASEAHRIKALLEGLEAHENAWHALLREGIIEFIDKQEEETLKVAIRISDLCKDASYTHCDIQPHLIDGLCASLIPHRDHNQAPRNTYQSAMGKQAVGVYATNFNHRMDTIAHVLCYPQRALVTTQVEEMLGTNVVPAGCCPVVVIMSYTGFNQEDSVIVNQSAIDRGIFRSFVYRAYKDEEKAIGADSEQFENPIHCSDCMGMRMGCYTKLSADGRVTPGTHVKQGDVLIGKTINTSDICEGNEARRIVKRDKSLIMKNNEPATVDAVLTSMTKEGNRYIKVRTRSLRIPRIGDKLSSRHGQKGVIGMVLSQEDMPFTSDGISPDIIINPHAIPSRMTIGQLVECLLGKLCTIDGRIGDGTPFRGTSIEQIADELEARGYQRHGNEKLVNGMTGKLMPGRVFIGPTFYQRLKHMVIDKQHSRARGPIQILTRQPVEGRSRDGGLRFGEMERDCIISHGAGNVLLERLFEQSDPFETHVCSQCGLLCHSEAVNMQVRGAKAWCNNCKSHEHAKVIRIPYAFKLLMHELYTMNIIPRIRVRDDKKVPVLQQQPATIH